MRELTFKGFLSRYVRELSSSDTVSLYKLAAEAGTNNPRLKEPLLLYAMFSNKQDVLMKATKMPSLRSEFEEVVLQYTVDEVLKMLKEKSVMLSEEYHKVWRSYISEKNRYKTDDYTKELVRKKVKRLQMSGNISNYRIYADLGLNPGNLNAWLKHGECGKVSLNTARKVLSYVENAAMH